MGSWAQLKEAGGLPAPKRSWARDLWVLYTLHFGHDSAPLLEAGSIRCAKHGHKHYKYAACLRQWFAAQDRVSLITEISRKLVGKSKGIMILWGVNGNLCRCNICDSHESGLQSLHLMTKFKGRVLGRRTATRPAGLRLICRLDSCSKFHLSGPRSRTRQSHPHVSWVDRLKSASSPSAAPTYYPTSHTAPQPSSLLSAKPASIDFLLPRRGKEHQSMPFSHFLVICGEFNQLSISVRHHFELWTVVPPRLLRSQQDYIHGVLRAGMQVEVACLSREIFQPKDQTRSSCYRNSFAVLNLEALSIPPENSSVSRLSSKVGSS